MRSVVSVHPAVFTLALEPTAIRPWYFARVWIMTTARRELKVSVTDQGQTLASGLMSAFSKNDNALV